MTAVSYLFDAPGPKGRRRIVVGSVVGGIVVAGMTAYAAVELAAKGQFAAAKWVPFVSNRELLLFLLTGLVNTMKAAVISLALALVLGTALAVGRLSRPAIIRVPCTAFLELVRGAPVLLTMFFLFLAFPRVFKIDLPPFWTVVLALTLYNGSVIAEIIRAGVLTLPKGQSEAASALGLRRSQTMRLILLPQAFRIMLPSLVSQLVVLTKDSALGFIIGYQELTAQAQSAALLLNNPLQTFVVVGLVYVVINSMLSAISGFLSRRQGRSHASHASDLVQPLVIEGRAPA